MRKDDLGFGYRETRNWRIVVPMIVVAVLLAVVIGILVKMSRDGGGPEDEPVISAEVGEGGSKAAEDTEDAADTKNTEGVDGGQIAGDAGDPQDALAGGMTSGEGASVDVTALLAADGANELSGRSMGIDVAKYQGTIDWAQVAGAGVEFAMVRVGYRTMETGEICEDTNARYNMQAVSLSLPAGGGAAADRHGFFHGGDGGGSRRGGGLGCRYDRAVQDHLSGGIQLRGIYESREPSVSSDPE